MSYAVIKGRIIYYAYYHSINEMRGDENLEEGYYVAVINNNTISNYRIINEYETGSIDLVNGKFAKLLDIDASTVTDSIKYSSIYPIEYPVGGIEEGEEFSEIKLTNLLHQMFFKSIVGSVVTPNIGEGPHVKGINKYLRSFHVKVNRSFEVISSISAVIGSQVYTVTFGHTEGDVDIDVAPLPGPAIVVNSDFDYQILYTLRGGEVIREDHIIKFVSPIYYNYIGDVLPGASEIKTYNQSLSDTEIAVTYSFDTLQRFFIAVPDGVQIKSIVDDSGINVMDAFTSDNISIGFDTIFVQYTRYYSRFLCGHNISVIYLIGER